MSYLFLVNIGPVQDFIASARRTRDLHFGSWLLSELSRAAAHEIVMQKPKGLNSLIFPAPAEERMLCDKEFNVANKIVALIQQSPQDLGPIVQQAVITRLRAIRDEAYKRISLDKKNLSIAEAQVEGLVECLWVALPFDGHNYQEKRQGLEALMAARKNTRDFAQVSWGAPVPKSSIDGHLESVIPEWEYPSPGISKEDKPAKIRALYDNYRAGPAERLSGVDLLKRWGDTAFDTHFPSTSHMATLPFLERLQIFKNERLEHIRKSWGVYIQEMQKLVPPSQLELEHIPKNYLSHPILGRYEGSMLFEDRLVNVLYEPGVEMSRNTDLQKAKKALDTFYQVLDREFNSLGFAKTRPVPYYAFLQADGDGMGALIDAQAKHDYERHRKLSSRLSSFTQLAREIVRKHRGALVYAGGDDVIAFLPLDTVLECASELAKSFREVLLEFSDQQSPNPSLSVGIAIAHHLDPLMRVRRLAKGAERRAKSVLGKNALAITVSKRSGEDYSIAGQWDNLDKTLQRLINFCQKGAIPVGTAYELRDLAKRLGVSTSHLHASPQKRQVDNQFTEVIQWDAFRIMQRKLYVPVGKFPREQTEEIERLFKAQLGIEQEPTSQLEREHMQPVPLNDFVNALIIAQVLADAKQLAMQKKEGRQL